jgi:hypothetical protein
MKKRTILVAAIAILAASTLAALTVRRVHARRFERNIALVHDGMTEREVVALLGRTSDQHRPCWAVNQRCSFDYVYPMPSTFLGYWVISFDRSGKVIDKDDWYSP